MRKKGITYLEIIIALALLSIVVTASLGFYLNNIKSYLTISTDVDEKANLRIALEYLIDTIIDSKGIGLVEVVEGKEVFVNEISVEDEAERPRKYLLAGTNKIYLINNIIRCNEKSNHVVSGVVSFSIKRRGEKLYTITVKSENNLVSTNVYKEK